MLLEDSPLKKFCRACGLVDVIDAEPLPPDIYLEEHGKIFFSEATKSEDDTGGSPGGVPGLNLERLIMGMFRRFYIPFGRHHPTINPLLEHMREKRFSKSLQKLTNSQQGFKFPQISRYYCCSHVPRLSMDKNT
jgi:hypothetical protein